MPRSDKSPEELKKAAKAADAHLALKAAGICAKLIKKRSVDPEVKPTLKSFEREFRAMAEHFDPEAKEQPENEADE